MSEHDDHAAAQAAEQLPDVTQIPWTELRDEPGPALWHSLVQRFRPAAPPTSVFANFPPPRGDLP